MAKRSRPKDFMATTEERLRPLWSKLTEDSYPCMLRENALEAAYEKLTDQQERRRLLALLQANHRLSFFFKLVVDCGTAIDEMLLADTLVNKSAWTNRALGHARTTGFAWSSFLNGTYQFRELLKQAFNQAESARKPFNSSVPPLNPTTLKGALKEVDRSIGHLIKWRGENTHNYIRQHRFVVGLGALEVLSSQGRKYEHRSRFVNAAKSLMRSEMQKAITGCVDVAEKFYVELRPTLLALSDELSALVASAGVTWSPKLATA